MPRDKQVDLLPLASPTMSDDSEKPLKGARAASVRADLALFSDLIGYRLRLATNAMTSDLKVTLEGTGQRPVLVAMLAVIARSPGIIQTALGNALGVQRANLVPLVNEVEERGWVDRRPAPNDKRAYALHLTADGERSLNEALARIAQHEARVFGRLTQRERETLKRLLGKVSS
jgi:DNA-binding MarR family transcriptional regulator